VNTTYLDLKKGENRCRGWF